jgi:hypothetical protein
MEPATTERVGELSSRRSRPKRQIRKSLSGSPLPSPRSTRKKGKRKKNSTSAEYFSVKEILDEREEQGRIEFLIDWEDDAESGESYTPTWVCPYIS